MQPFPYPNDGSDKISKAVVLMWSLLAVLVSDFR